MTQTTDKANQFFECYAAALLARDKAAMAGMYAIPSLILFPGNFDSGDRCPPNRGVLRRLPGAVRRSRFSRPAGSDHGRGSGDCMGRRHLVLSGPTPERFCYQLIEGADGYQIAVLTPMELAPT
ncbi:MAG TPA: hypothetical protein VM848_14860 [Acidimicrobiia bacterium]|nr:hypothetical protein [Acidimicrobiia bacterium]